MRKFKYIAAFLAGAALIVILATILNNHAAKPETSAAPMRIVSAAPQLTEILYALGLESRIAAVSGDSDYPPAAARKRQVGTFWQLNMEAIITAKPDLVIIEAFEQQLNVGRRLEALGYRVVTVNIESIDGLLAAIQQIGQATATQAQADELVTQIKSRVITLSGRLTCLSKPSVLWVVQTQPLRVAGRETFPNELISLAGANNAIGPTVQKYPPIGAEQILACNADIIIQPATTPEKVEAEQNAALEFWSKYPTLPAVKNRRIYVINPDPVSRLGPRLDQGLTIVGKCIHPSVFEPAPANEPMNKEDHGKNSDSQNAGR
jgi:iron complex transport system substrate-binding protein